MCAWAHWTPNILMRCLFLEIVICAICLEETASPPRGQGVTEGGVAESSGVGGAKLFEAGARRDGDDDEEDGAEQGWKSRGGEAGCGRRLAAMTRPVIARVIATNV